MFRFLDEKGPGLFHVPAEVIAPPFAGWGPRTGHHSRKKQLTGGLEAQPGAEKVNRLFTGGILRLPGSRLPAVCS